MEKYKSLISSGLFTVFFGAQAIGYIHGYSLFEKINAESTVAFGVYHLAHIFQPQNNVAWPLSPLVCGVLLLMIPFIEADEGTPIQKENFSKLFTALLIPVTISTLEVSIIGPENAAILANELLTRVNYPILLSLIYFGLYTLTFVFCWKLRHAVVKAATKVQLIFPKPFLLLITIIWLLYGCYLGSRFDGALDSMNLTKEELFIKSFFQDTN